ncbi:MAG TPA: Lrp/AsnC ligand binding domain-containing protein, partial [Conexibacter sp.]|nr:Lrp/AsnC ligand binding domain-containing protein [Conexibacter sp.]
LGYEAMAMLAISTTGMADRVAQEIAAWDEASHVVVTAGHHDVIVEVVCRDRQHLLELINRVRAIDEVTSTETFVYLDLVKQTYDWRPTSE